MDDLEKLFASYRESLPDPEPTAGFTPGVWERIEARRSPVRMLKRLTEALVAVTALATLVVGLFLLPQLQKSPVYTATYIDVLAAEHSSETLAYADVLHTDQYPDQPNR